MPAPVIMVLIGLAAAGALLAAWLLYRRHEREPGHFVDLNVLRQLSWGELEILVADYFVREGFVLREQGGKAVDFVLEKGGQRQLVQCKHWRARRVDEAAVRDLFGHMAALRATSAYMLTGGRFSRAAVRFASGKRIELIDGAGLVRLVEEVQQDPSEITQSRLDAMRDADQTQPRRVILCPRCGRPMSRRQERGQAGNGGRAFYGCSRYPTCKGRREIA
ncbi:MAG TPA: restriction endonuclease [Gammaproteobacteria bacterium]